MPASYTQQTISGWKHFCSSRFLHKFFIGPSEFSPNFFKKPTFNFGADSYALDPLNLLQGRRLGWHLFETELPRPRQTHTGRSDEGNQVVTIQRIVMRGESASVPLHETGSDNLQNIGVTDLGSSLSQQQDHDNSLMQVVLNINLPQRLRLELPHQTSAGSEHLTTNFQTPPKSKIFKL